MMGKDNVHFHIKETYAVNVPKVTLKRLVTIDFFPKIIIIESETCVNCQIDVLYYLKSIGFFLIQIITAFYSVRYYFKSLNSLST